jgi:hypothetical protein
MQRLEGEFGDAGKKRQFEELKGFLIGQQDSATYAEAAVTLGMTEAAVKMASHRMRRRYRDLLRAEIRETLSSPDEVEDEIAKLFASLES